MQNTTKSFPITYAAGNIVLNAYSETNWVVTEHLPAFSEYSHFSNGAEAIIFFIQLCMADDCLVPSETLMHMCEFTESDLINAIGAACAPTER